MRTTARSPIGLPSARRRVGIEPTIRPQCGIVALPDAFYDLLTVVINKANADFWNSRLKRFRKIHGRTCDNCGIPISSGDYCSEECDNEWMSRFCLGLEYETTSLNA